VVSIIPCDNLENAIEIANNIEYGLSSSLYTKDVNKAFAAFATSKPHHLHQRSDHRRRSHLPFGGTKATGNGHREGGIGASTSTPSGKLSTSITPTRCKRHRLTGWTRL